MSDSRRSENALTADARQPRRYWGFRQISFVVLMAGLTALFIALGTWQVERLAEKEALIAAVEARFDLEPQPFRPWRLGRARSGSARLCAFELTGTFDNTETVLVFTNLPDPAGRYGGVGYWVMAPFSLEQGGIVWVNRGFIPDAAAADFADGGDAPEGQVTLEAIARRPEQANSFTLTPISGSGVSGFVTRSGSLPFSTMRPGR